MVTKQKILISSIWKMMDSLVTKGVSTVISIILARILMPEDYGIITITIVFINFSGIIVQSGINVALVRKEAVDELDYSTSLFYSLVVAGLCYAIFFFLAPCIAAFYGKDIICQVIRIQMVTLFIGAFGNVRNAIVIREFKFKELCFINAISTVSGGVVGIVLAYGGMGVWALVFYTLIRDLLSVCLLFIWVRWKPLFHISFIRLKELMTFSVWVLLSSILDFWGNNLSSIILGKKYSMSDLGTYSKGGQLAELICLHTFGAVSSILLPTMANSQSDNEKLKNISRKMVSVSSYIIFPMMIGLAVIADRLIPVLYTEKWNGCVPILYMSCIYFGINPFRTINMQLMYAKGDSRIAMIVEVTRFFLLNGGIIAVIFLFKKDIYWVSRVTAVVAVCTAVITQKYAKGMIGYHYFEWVQDMLPHISITAAMGIVVYMVGKIALSDIVVLVAQVMAGVIAYYFFSIVSRNRMYYELKDLMIGAIKKNWKGKVGHD